MTPNEKKNTAADRRRARIVARLAGIRHWLLGSLSVQPVPGTVFRPERFFADPGRLRDCLYLWRYKARRDGCGSGLPRELREAALDQAAQNCLAWFLDLPYARLGVTADEFARAVMLAYKRCKKAFWRDRAEHREFMRNARMENSAGSWQLFNRAANSRTADPRRIVHAADALGQDVHAVTGEGVSDEIPGPLVSIPGGPSGRGETDGKMRLVTVADKIVNRAGGAFCRDRLELQFIESRWRMVRGRGKARKLPACTVREGVPAPRPVFRQNPPPAAGVPRPEGITTARAARALPPVTAADAVYNLRRLGRGLPRHAAAPPDSCGTDRRRIAAALRRMRAALRQG